MKILISGATGFIGSHLIPILIKNGNEITAISRNIDRASSNLPAEVKVINWDGNALREAVAGVDAVINLAGESIAGSRWTRNKKASILNSRLLAAQRLRDAVKVAQKKEMVFIQASAIGFYGNSGDRLCFESDSAGKGFLAHVCSKWESHIPEICEFGVRTVVARTGVVLGRDDGFLYEMLKLSRRRLAGKIGNGRQWVSWIHVGDVVNAIIHLMNSEDLAGAFNLVAPFPVQQKEFSRKLALAAGKGLQFGAPAFPIKLLLGEMGTELILGGQKVSAKKLQNSGFTFMFEELDKALADLIGKKSG
ncbi:MAG TPA: TIGR01777 family oxidoreductase [Bacteroidales bacterium]|nr:TIGR01777 family oxidoreductase [Bacteroidales bacterium]